MERSAIHNLLFSELESGKEIMLSVVGISMNPIMLEGDSITIVHSEFYAIGDVLAFVYKNEFLVHRLIKIEKGRFFCKGDNSFRLEDVELNDVAGKVVRLNGKPIPTVPEDNISLSYLVNREFRKSRYNVETTKKSGIYRFYCQSVFGVRDNTIKYRIKSTARTQSYKLIESIFANNYYDTKFPLEKTIDKLVTTLNDFCSINLLLSQILNDNSLSHENKNTDVMLSFLCKGIISGYIEVI